MSPRVSPNKCVLVKVLIKVLKCVGHDTPIFTMLYLILLLYGSINILSEFFLGSHPGLKQCMLRKLSRATFLGNFPVLLVQHICGALMNSCLLEYATVFPIKNTF